jgi:hypothetical protein
LRNSSIANPLKTLNIIIEEMGGYVLATTTETDENRMVKTPGTINGGEYPAACKHVIVLNK